MYRHLWQRETCYRGLARFEECPGNAEFEVECLRCFPYSLQYRSLARSLYRTVVAVGGYPSLRRFQYYYHRSCGTMPKAPETVSLLPHVVTHPSTDVRQAQRLDYIDQFRGFTMLSMVLVNFLGDGGFDATPPFFR